MCALEVLRFLQYYRQYPCLWDESLNEYKDQSKRDLAEADLIKIMKFDTVKSLRATILSIRCAFNNEVRKVRQSRSQGCGSGAVYKPDLLWYNYAYAFLKKNLGREFVELSESVLVSKSKI